MAVSTRRLRPVHTPKSRPSTITRTVATRVLASVTIASYQTPVPRMIATQTAVEIKARTPPSRYARASSTPAINQNGDSASNDCNGLRNP